MLLVLWDMLRYVGTSIITQIIILTLLRQRSLSYRNEDRFYMIGTSVMKELILWNIYKQHWTCFDWSAVANVDAHLGACQPSTMKLFDENSWQISIIDVWRGPKYASAMQKYISLHNLLTSHLISWCGNFVEMHIFYRVSGEFPETMRKLCVSTKFRHQEIRWNCVILCCVCCSEILEAYHIILLRTTLNEQLEVNRLNIFQNGVT